MVVGLSQSTAGPVLRTSASHRRFKKWDLQWNRSRQWPIKWIETCKITTRGWRKRERETRECDALHWFYRISEFVTLSFIAFSCTVHKLFHYLDLSVVSRIDKLQMRIVQCHICQTNLTSVATIQSAEWIKAQKDPNEFITRSASMRIAAAATATHPHIQFQNWTNLHLNGDWLRFRAANENKEGTKNTFKLNKSEWN